MQIVTPVTDYIPASLLTTNNDIVERLAGVNARKGTRSQGHVYLSGDQSIGASSVETIEFDTAERDVNTDFDLVNHYLVIPNNGVYAISCWALTDTDWPANSRCYVQIAIDGGAALAIGQAHHAFVDGISVGCVVFTYFTAAQHVIGRFSNPTAGAEDIRGSSAYETGFSWVEVI